jgi:hypothetical protein
MTRLSPAAFAFLVLVACGSQQDASGKPVSDAGPADAPSPWHRTFACTSTESLTFTEPTGASPQTVATLSTVQIDDSGAGRITLTGADDAGVGCPLSFDLSGDDATLAPGESCAVGGLSVAYTSGTAILSGTVLTVSLDFAFQGVVSSDAPAVSVAGSATLSSSCDST